jgi:hypothetical protein
VSGISRSTSIISDTFYGGGEYGFVNVDEYSELERHLEELEAAED